MLLCPMLVCTRDHIQYLLGHICKEFENLLYSLDYRKILVLNDSPTDLHNIDFVR